MHDVRSMTGFASLRENLKEGLVSFDLKSVNSKYFEFFFKGPENLKTLEGPLRETLKSKVSRGKCEVYLNFIPAKTEKLNLNEDLIFALGLKLKTIKERLGESTVNLTDLLFYPGVIISDSSVDENVTKSIKDLFPKAVDAFIKSRQSEGLRLASALLQKLDLMEQLLRPIGDNLKSLVKNEYEKLKERLLFLKDDFGEDRIMQEAAVLAQKADISEEYDRLYSHIVEVRSILEKGGLIGKRLDFMMQELNRETNTMASKASNLNITKTAVELKVLIEQMREQVQNLE